ncbi:type VI secretion system protein ImpG [Photobacterium jeanii]|uniref:Type VI secretion system protein ImpG n=1 Tax=Photobacterium jeanii TaxID=858640 RepID=A0A178K1T4_9GAMM|nr:type VI secretion system baseplate subunit TssF [Photobacterium jeanii]OAN11066.1 type VI secretion system protein ImpG [Photobacterium jeanii]PST90580.1 type VI secretion system baseplate subunit TssF [Photobacterium jeanii]
MSDDLLKYYNRELAYIRRMGAEYAEKYPKIAGRLRISDDQVEDPHASRIIEAFSLLTAQIRRSIDDNYPQLTEALIGQLYPDYHATIPPMSVIKLTSKDNVNVGFTVPKANTVELVADHFKRCQFQTCYQTQLWPFDLAGVQFENAPFTAPEAKFPKTARSVMKLNLACHDEEQILSEVDFSCLRFYLSGLPHLSYPLYQLLMRSLVGIAIVSRGESSQVKYISPKHVRATGFDEFQAVLPYGKQSFAGYRMLVEYFLLPEKYLFVELFDLDSAWFGDLEQADIYFYFDDVSDVMPKQLTSDNVLLGCTPIINLFEKQVEPIALDSVNYEYRITPSFNQSESNEVIRVESVKAYNWNNAEVDVVPFYRGEHPNYLSEHELYWNIRREDANWAGGFDEPGRETYIAVIDRLSHQFEPEEQDRWSLRIDTLCSNRNLAARLPFGGGQPKVFLGQQGDVFEQARCLFPPTEPVRPRLHDSTRWQLAKLLTLNSFSDQDSLSTLKETLRLYDFKASPQTKVLIDAIIGLKVTPATARVNQHGRVGFCHGSDIDITFSANDVQQSTIFMFSHVLAHFFAQYAAVNSFTRLRVWLQGQEQAFHEWPATAGGQVLL